MIFTRTKRAAQRLSDELVDRGFQATSIHGDLNQVAREKALKKFRDGKVSVLVATDVAARGIDITDVSHVVNYECPDSEMTYVHRIGRTGRAGAKGNAVTLVDWADITRWKVINKTLNLDFPEPPETYSTSQHLLDELEIPAGTRGRITEAAPREPRHDRSTPAGDHKPRGERPKHDRSRRRLRNGEPVEGGAEVLKAEPIVSGDAAERGAVGEASDHKRHRRRHSGGTRPADS
jgi:superfamily II DNA/RNA helicase